MPRGGGFLFKDDFTLVYCQPIVYLLFYSLAAYILINRCPYVNTAQVASLNLSVVATRSLAPHTSLLRSVAEFSPGNQHVGDVENWKNKNMHLVISRMINN